jgi:16S rRNA G966 N2-methylase RsmD
MTSLRVTGGALRGRRVPVPAGEVRPTSERARQAYFNIVSDRLPGARFLDLFAGSGVFSFEALSRGAAAALAVEQNERQCALIEQTAAAFGVEVTAVAGDAIGVVSNLARPHFALRADLSKDRGPKRSGYPSADHARRASQRPASSGSPALPSAAPFDLVYADPPYEYSRYDELVDAIAAAPLAVDALVAIEHRRRTEPFQETVLRQTRRAEYGEVWITFFER